MPQLTVSRLGLLLLCSVASIVHGNFLANNVSAARLIAAQNVVPIAEVTMSLDESFEHVLGQHGGADGLQIEAIEASIGRTFQALPKNAIGRLTPRSVRYIVHNYFSKEHGWLLEGLEPHAMQVNVSELHSASILQEKAPMLVESLLEDRQRGRGLSFEDIVTMIAALEQLIFKESVSLLETAYELNGVRPETDVLNELGAHEVLRTYLILFRMGSSADLGNSGWHTELKMQMDETPSAFWQELVEYEQDAVLNAAFAHRHTSNPFRSNGYTFESVAGIVKQLTHSYGKWQNDDCVAMKEHLMGLDPSGSGRVPLDRFYSQPDDSAYTFAESVDYLRSIGALEESSSAFGRTSHVRIANYVAGPTNCIAHSAYYSVCCLSECEALMTELEGRVQAPTSSAEQLLRLVGGLSSSTVDTPRQFSEDMASRLRRIGEQHGGAVRLHGRLFAQWMHFAFPHECPYPQKVSAAALTPSQWLNGSASAGFEERELHMEAASAASGGSELEPSMAYWSDDEVLLFHDAPHGFEGSWHAAGRFGIQAFGTCMRLTPILIVFRALHTAWQAAVSAHRGTSHIVKIELGHLV